MANTVHRICTLCEATCGLSIDVDGGRVVTLKGDRDDPFSQGYVCPKAWGMKELQEDGDRLNEPLVRKNGRLQPASWDEAFARAISGICELRSQHGPDSVATYLGNPSAHSLHAMIYGSVVLRALGSKQRYSATSADQLPKHVSSALLFGRMLPVPVPDVDRTDLLVMLGANPVVSGGSLMTAPGMKKRLQRIQARGGRVVVIDPRRTETALLADEHLFLRPGTDAWLLLAMARELFELGTKLARYGQLINRADELRVALAPFTPERAAERTGVSADRVRSLARELLEVERGVCYGRIGTTCQRWGTLSSWAVDAVNLLAGKLDQPGGAMFATPAAYKGQNPSPKGKRGRSLQLGRWRSHARDLPEAFGELPVAGLADEICREGDDRVRGLLTIAGNPALSAPGSDQLQRALGRLELMVSVDFYLNETTRHADVILPPPPPLERDTYDVALYTLAVRNVAKYSLPAIEKSADRPDEWEILLTLAKGFMGQQELDLEMADNFVLSQVVGQELPDDGGRWPGLTQAEVMEKLGGRPGPQRVLDLFLRLGPHGDGFGRNPGGVSLEKLRAHPHGLDLGPLEPQLPEFLATQDGRIDLYPELIASEMHALTRVEEVEETDLLLIGRRQLRSNNSWMHNLPALVKGPARCTLLVHPSDAQRLGLRAGGQARCQTAAGEVRAPVEISDEIMPGVVSLPHGWGHSHEDMRMSVAQDHAGVNVNVLSDNQLLDVSGNAAFNGVPVRVSPA